MKFEGISVDAGLIIIADKNYYLNEPWSGIDVESSEKCQDLGQVAKLPPGKYSVKWKIADTWNGPVAGEGILDLPSGTVVVMDPCYASKPDDDDDTWGVFCDRLYKGWRASSATPDPGTLVLDTMGGDGTYTVEVEFTKLEESNDQAIPNPV